MFQRKKIAMQETAGSLLFYTRTQMKFSVDEVASKLRIAPRYVLALEQSRYDELPGDVYSRCFIRYLAELLELDSDEIIMRFQSERKIYKNTKNAKAERDFSRPVIKLSKFHFLVTPRIIRGFLIVLVAGICLAYLALKVEAIVQPPELLVYTPATDILTKSRVIRIFGKTQPETSVAINNQQVLVDETGIFSKNFDLSTGLNIITIRAKRDYGKESVLERRVVVEEEELP